MTTRLAPVISLNQRRYLNCPHCDLVMQIRHLDPHIDVCPVIVAKRAGHPSPRGA